MKRAKRSRAFILKSASGDGFPLTVAVTLSLLLLFSAASEYFRVFLIAQGIRDAVQQAVIETETENYDEVYHAAREGYAAGYEPESGGWAEHLDTGDVYANLSKTLGLVEENGIRVKYSGGEKEFTISNLNVKIQNDALASGRVSGFCADASVNVEIPSAFAGRSLPPVRMKIRTQAKYVPKF